MKENCWEFMGCEKNDGGSNAVAMGICPASTEKLLDGTHAGINAGRACWVVAGTFCNGEVQGYFAKKQISCVTCSFYSKVREEEAGSFEPVSMLLEKLRVETLNFNGKFFYYDHYGDLWNAEDWSREFAEYLIKRDGLDFGEEHWGVINYLRKYYGQYGVTPMANVIVKRLKAESGNDRYSMKHLFRLFGTTPVKNACKYAGVPSPGCT